jgi:hypothetical protein
MSLTHFFSFALQMFSAIARAMTRAGTGDGEKGKGKSEKGKSSSGGQGDDEGKDSSCKVSSDNDCRGRYTVAIKVVVVEKGTIELSTTIY